MVALTVVFTILHSCGFSCQKTLVLQFFDVLCLAWALLLVIKVGVGQISYSVTFDMHPSKKVQGETESNRN